MNTKKINIFISGDFASFSRVKETINKRDYRLLYNDILPVIKGADIKITNLEVPLLENGKPIAKTGPNLKSPINTIEALKYAGFDMVTLANNHAMDFGTDGLMSTIELCDKNDIKHIGAGPNLLETKKIQYYEIRNTKIAFINCCENEWSTTRGEDAGCNPMDEVSIYYQIQEAKSNANHVIMIVHGGHETYEYPSPRMKKLYRWFVDLGVDAVIGHHTHCFSGYEIYKGKPIVYSLGNFVFDDRHMPRGSSWNIGAAALLSIDENDIHLNLFPFKQNDDIVGVHLFDEKETKRWLEKERERTEVIQDDVVLRKKFEAFVDSQEKFYRSYLEPNESRWVHWAKNHGYLPRRIKGAKRLLFWNIIRNEAHRDILLEILSKDDCHNK